jgi:drug/metabolite transporter (DMT)-like permease
MIERDRCTVQGILAVLFWGSTIAVSRSLAEKVGTLTAASCIFLIAGGVSCTYFIISHRFQGISRVSRAYLYGGGSLFILYSVCLYIAIGTAASRLQVLEIGLVNNLWPSLTFVMAVPFLRLRARATLIPGCVLAFGGVLLAAAAVGESWQVFVANLETNSLPYLLALVAAFCWALYSNLTRRWARETENGAVPLFLLVSGIVLATLRFLFPLETVQWANQSIIELAYIAVFSTSLAYVFWDMAMRMGDMILVTALSYLIPLLSIIIGSVYLGVGTGLYLWAGCLLVIAGSIVCKLSVKENPSKSQISKLRSNRSPRK